MEHHTPNGWATQRRVVVFLLTILENHKRQPAPEFEGDGFLFPAFVDGKLLCFFLPLLRRPLGNSSRRWALLPEVVKKCKHNAFDAIVHCPIGSNAQAVTTVLSVLYIDLRGLQVLDHVE